MLHIRSLLTVIFLFSLCGASAHATKDHEFDKETNKKINLVVEGMKNANSEVLNEFLKRLSKVDSRVEAFYRNNFSLEENYSVLQENKEPKYKIVLSIDGGGVRGVAPLHFLEVIAKKLGKPMREIADFFCCTSTGALIGLGIIGGIPEEVLSQKYREDSEKIFSVSWLDNLSSFWGFKNSYYDIKKLIDTLQELVPDKTLQELSPDFKQGIVINTTDLENHEPFYFSNYDKATTMCSAIMVAAASCAAPTYFNPVEMEIEGQKRQFVDGCVSGRNWPAYEALLKAQDFYENDPDIHYIVLALGTGYFHENKDIQNGGKVEWLENDISGFLIETAAKGEEQRMKRIAGKKVSYYRLQFELSKDFYLDTTKASDIDQILKDASTQATMKVIDQFCDLIKEIEEAKKNPNANWGEILKGGMYLSDPVDHGALEKKYPEIVKLVSIKNLDERQTLEPKINNSPTENKDENNLADPNNDLFKSYVMVEEENFPEIQDSKNQVKEEKKPTASKHSYVQGWW